MTLLSARTLDFLTQLRANNDRAWFTAHKAAYDEAFRFPAEAFAEVLGAELERLTGAPHQHKVFRIHRDVRFSRDKTPYNSHLHISLSPAGGCREGAPVWMFGLDPDGLTVGAGLFEFSSAQLAAWRELISGEKGAEFAALLEGLAAKGVHLSEPELKRVPSPYSADHPRAALLRRKGLTAWIDCPDPSQTYGAEGPAFCAGELLRLRELVNLLDALDR